MSRRSVDGALVTTVWRRLRAHGDTLMGARLRVVASGPWTRDWDITDRVRMAVLRSRLAGWMIVLGTVPAVRGTTSGSSAASSENMHQAVAMLVLMPAVGVFLVWRGRRVAEAAFAGSLASVVVLVATARVLTERVGSPAGQDAVFLIPLVLVAVFVERRRFVVLQTAVSVAASAWGTWHRLADDPALGQVVMANSFAFVAVSVVVRVLRDLAHEAVARAKVGEVTDPLTGLLNRRGYERHGVRAFDAAARRGTPLVLLLVDVDHFKRVNDTLGHAAGDELLRRLAELLTSSLREGDYAFRLGGEEFAVLARCSPGQASVICERLRLRVESELPVTVSIGAVEARPEPGDTAADIIWSLVDRADTGLYAAKNAGRNTVRLA